MKDLVASLLAPALDGASDTPLNEQLAQGLRKAVLEGSIAMGARLPSSRALADRLSVSRNTVLAAYDQLIAEGYLETRQGAGTYVSTDLPDRYLRVRPDGAAPAPNLPVRLPRPLAGMPALDHFPQSLWARLAGSVWRHAGPEHLQHMDPQGYRPLRQAIATYLAAARGVVADADQVLIVTGLQPGLKLLAESVVPPDRALILEDPGYPGLKAAIDMLRHPLAYTNVDDSGACVPTGLSADPGLLVVCPSRQYPLGHTMPLRRRLELLDWARQTGCLILEDDYDSEFRYAGRPVSALQGIDGGQNVIYGGSFSKSLYVALRLGYLILPPHLVDRVVRFRAATESFPAIGPQMLLARFIEEGHFGRHLRHLRTVHRARLDLFMKAARRELAPYIEMQDADAGLQLVGFRRPLLHTVPDTVLATLAHRAGIGAVAVSSSYVHALARHGLMFGFANIAEDEIDNRLKALRRLIAEETGF